jgi:hypothetical protein
VAFLCWKLSGLRESQNSVHTKGANKITALDAAMTILFHFESYRRGASELIR